MKYIIDEEELKKYSDYCGWSFKSMVEVLNLKSKQPVVTIAEGEVTADIPDLGIYFISHKQINAMFEEFVGKKGKLYWVGEI
jgi:hypothetical protein